MKLKSSRGLIYGGNILIWKVNFSVIVFKLPEKNKISDLHELDFWIFFYIWEEKRDVFYRQIKLIYILFAFEVFKNLVKLLYVRHKAAVLMAFTNCWL